MRLTDIMVACNRMKNIFDDKEILITERGLYVTVGSQTITEKNIDLDHTIKGLQKVGWKVNVQDWGLAGTDYIFYLRD